MNKRVFFHVVRIFLTLLYFSISTYLIYSYNDNLNFSLAYMNSNNNLSVIEHSDGITLEDAYPVSDQVGLLNDGYTFEIVNNTSDKKDFSISFINTINDENVLDNRFLRYQVIKNGEVFIESKTVSSDGRLFSDNVITSNIYTIKLWISEDATIEAMGKIFSSKIAVI